MKAIVAYSNRGAKSLRLGVRLGYCQPQYDTAERVMMRARFLSRDHMGVVGQADLPLHSAADAKMLRDEAAAIR
jgi:hypothetical protein